MRRLSCVSIVCLLIGCLSLQLGCRSQALPVANPFMAPAVVPPPATRTPAPGTAAPYYPGDPLPGSSPVSAPAPIAPPAAYPPAAAPPSGWGSPPVSDITPTPSGVQQAGANIALGPTESVQVPADNSALRFSQPQQAQAFVPAPQQFQPTVQQATAPPAQFSGSQQFSPPQADVAQLQYIQQPPASAEQRPVVLREISSESALSRESGTHRIGSDGFRPQGSSRTAREQQKVSRPVAQQSLEPQQVANNEVADRFGFDPQYTWLRGKLERSPGTGQWQLRYIPLQAERDQFGGTVPIANPQVLGELQNGDYVAVHGQMELVQLGGAASVPSFTIAVLQRQQHDLR